jgi:putative addiction module component (TIGR02574 family)
MSIYLAEEVLALAPQERAELAKLLIESLESDPRSDSEIRQLLTERYEALLSGTDLGLTAEQVFERP